MEKKKILMVSGGVADQYLFETSVFYASFCEDFGKYIIQNATLLPDGKISFPKSLKKEDYESAPKYDIFEGGSLIKKMNIDCIYYLPNSWKGLTTYRAAFELLDIPILGPSSDSQGIAFNKINTRARLGAEGIKFAPGCEIKYQDKDDLQNALRKMKENSFTFPVVVKAPCEDDSLGIFIVREEKDLVEAINNAFEFQNKNEVLIEKFIVGREIRTCVIQDENMELMFLPVFEYGVDKNDIRKNYFKQIDFKATKNEECKRVQRTHLTKEIEGDLIKRLEKTSFECFKILNAVDYAVFDFRYNTEEDQYYLLEAGLFSHYCYKCNVAMLAKEAEISLEKLFDIGFNNAVKRFNAKKAFEKNKF